MQFTLEFYFSKGAPICEHLGGPPGRKAARVCSSFSEGHAYPQLPPFSCPSPKPLLLLFFHLALNIFSTVPLTQQDLCLSALSFWRSPPPMSFLGESGVFRTQPCDQVPPVWARKDLPMQEPGRAQASLLCTRAKHWCLSLHPCLYNGDNDPFSF